MFCEKLGEGNVGLADSSGNVVVAFVEVGLGYEYPGVNEEGFVDAACWGVGEAGVNEGDNFLYDAGFELGGIVSADKCADEPDDYEEYHRRKHQGGKEGSIAS